MRIDRAFKELLMGEDSSLVRRLGGGTPVEWLNPEFPKTRAPRADLVARLEDGSLFHLEVQSGNDSDMAWRQLEYYASICQQYGDAPRQVVLYVGDDPLAMSFGIEHERLRFAYDVVDIRDWSSEELLASPLPIDSIPAVLCRDGGAHRIPEIVSRLARLKPGRRERALQLLLVLSGLRGIAPRVADEVERMNVYVDPMKDGYLRGLIERGREEGLQQSLTRLLTHRFGPLPQWAKRRIAKAEFDTLEHWLIRAIDGATLKSVLEEK